MELTCLGLGKDQEKWAGPSCHLLQVDGAHLLLECPLDLAVLHLFLPAGQDVRFHTAAHDSKRAEITMGTLYKDCSAKRQRLAFYDEDEDDDQISWFHMDEIQRPQHKPQGYQREKERSGQVETMSTLGFTRVVAGQVFLDVEPWYKTAEFGLLDVTSLSAVLISNPEACLVCPFLLAWRIFLERKKDIENCLKQVQCLHYDEEVSLYDCLCIKPSSSGSELGASNWTITGARRLSYFSASDFTSGHSMALNVNSHFRSEIILFSDLKSNCINEVDVSVSSCSLWKDTQGSLCQGEVESRQEAFCANLVDELPRAGKAISEAVVSGGSVLVLISGIGAFLEALEVVSQTFDSSDLSHVPLFFISPVAEELLIYSNTIPEWLCATRQEKLYAGEALFHHVELLQQKRLHQLSSLYSAKAVKLWKEPCVVFVLNWGLRLGPAVPLLYRWRQDPHCLLVLPQTGIDAELALAPFQPLRMQVLHYNRGGKLGDAEVAAIIENLKPEMSLVPETMRTSIQSLFDGDDEGSSVNTAFYKMWDVLTIPGPQFIEADMAAEVACSIRPKQLDLGIAISHVTMRVQQNAGKWLLGVAKSPKGEGASLTASEHICWGSVKVSELVKMLQEHGLSWEVHSRVQDDPTGENVTVYCIDISSPSRAKVELRPHCTIIETEDTSIRQLLTDSVKSFLTCV